jgi:hypothetical protein
MATPDRRDRPSGEVGRRALAGRELDLPSLVACYLAENLQHRHLDVSARTDHSAT